MKTAFKITAVILALLAIVTLFAGCGSTLKGTYAPADGGSGTITFEEENKVTGELFGISISGTYTIEKDKIKFESEKILGIGATKEYSFKKSGKSIFIDEKEYVKQ